MTTGEDLLYPKWEAYFPEHKPATLTIWGNNDAIFVAVGAAPYKLDIPNTEVHLFDIGHLHGHEISKLIREFLSRNLNTGG
jgi:hypothetical protein